MARLWSAIWPNGRTRPYGLAGKPQTVVLARHDGTDENLTIYRRARAILAGCVGNLVQWYDWYIYSSAAIYFAPAFFPKGSQTVQLLQAAAVFAVGFLARPLGAWLMGLYGDYLGRKAALKLAVALMSVGSLAIAFSPGTNEIGMAAPVILALARICQGLALGGEYGASATYISEMAGKSLRGFWSGFNYVTLIAGQLLAFTVLMILQTFLTRAQMSHYGWRIPFALGGSLAIVAYYLRHRMEESYSFVVAKAQGVKSGSVWTLIRNFPKESLIIIGLTAGGSLIFYVYTNYMQKFLTNTGGFTVVQATRICAAALFIFMCAQPVVGFLSDKWGRKWILAASFGASALATWPILTCLAAKPSQFIAFILVLSGMLGLSGYSALCSIVKAELFPTNVRILGVALPFAIANALFGGTAEYLALWFKNNGNEAGFFLYSSLVLAFAFLVVLLMPDTRKMSRIAED